MKRTLEVCLGDEGRLVGTLRYDQNGAREHAAFAYDETWLAAADRFALEPNLPLVTGTQFHRKAPEGSVFHAAFADTEPDGSFGGPSVPSCYLRMNAGSRIFDYRAGH